MKRLISLALPLAILFLFSCTPPKPTFSFSHASPLQDKGTIRMKIEVEFKREAGVKELEKELDRVKYSLQLVFRSMKVSEVSGTAGMRKSENTIKKALKQQLREEVRRVKVSDFTISGVK